MKVAHQILLFDINTFEINGSHTADHIHDSQYAKQDGEEGHGDFAGVWVADEQVFDDQQQSDNADPSLMLDTSFF